MWLIAKFSAVDVKTVVKRETPLRYDEKGYIGIGVSGGAEVLRVTPYDRIFVMRKSGIYTVCDVPQKLFVDAGMVYQEEIILLNCISTAVLRARKSMESKKLTKTHQNVLIFRK